MARLEPAPGAVAGQMGAAVRQGAAQGRPLRRVRRARGRGRHGAMHRSAPAGSPLRRRRVAALAVQRHPAGLPAEPAVVAQRHDRRRRRRAAPRAGRVVRRAPAAGHDVARELRRDEPGSAGRDRAAGRHELRRRHGARRGRLAAHAGRPPACRRRRLRPGPPGRRHAGPRRAAQPPDGTDPVRAGDAGRARGTRADRARVDHEVLHPRPVGAQLARQLPRRPRAHRLHDLVAQPGRGGPRPRHGRLPASGRAGGARRRERHRARTARARGRLLPGRHPARDRRRLPGRPARRTPEVGDAVRGADGFHGSGRTVAVHRRQRTEYAGRHHVAPGLPGDAPDGRRVPAAALQRPRLVAHRQRLPAGPAPADDRPDGVERGRHAHAVPDAQRIPAPAVPEERLVRRALPGRRPPRGAGRHPRAAVRRRHRDRPRGAVEVRVQDPPRGRRRRDVRADERRPQRGHRQRAGPPRPALPPRPPHRRRHLSRAGRLDRRHARAGRLLVARVGRLAGSGQHGPHGAAGAGRGRLPRTRRGPRPLPRAHPRHRQRPQHRLGLRPRDGRVRRRTGRDLPERRRRTARAPARRRGARAARAAVRRARAGPAGRRVRRRAHPVGHARLRRARDRLRAEGRPAGPRRRLFGGRLRAGDGRVVPLVHPLRETGRAPDAARRQPDHLLVLRRRKSRPELQPDGPRESGAASVRALARGGTGQPAHPRERRVARPDRHARRVRPRTLRRTAGRRLVARAGAHAGPPRRRGRVRRLPRERRRTARHRQRRIRRRRLPRAGMSMDTITNRTFDELKRHVPQGDRARHVERRADLHRARYPAARPGHGLPRPVAALPETRRPRRHRDRHADRRPARPGKTPRRARLRGDEPGRRAGGYRHGRRHRAGRESGASARRAAGSAPARARRPLPRAAGGRAGCAARAHGRRPPRRRGLAARCRRGGARGADRTGARGPGSEDPPGGRAGEHRPRAVPHRAHRAQPRRGRRRRGAGPCGRSGRHHEGRAAHGRIDARRRRARHGPAHRAPRQPRVRAGRADLPAPAVPHGRRGQHLPDAGRQARHRAERDRPRARAGHRRAARGAAVRAGDRVSEDRVDHRGGRAVQDGGPRPDHGRRHRRADGVRPRRVGGSGAHEGLRVARRRPGRHPRRARPRSGQHARQAARIPGRGAGRGHRARRARADHAHEPRRRPAGPPRVHQVRRLRGTGCRPRGDRARRSRRRRRAPAPAGMGAGRHARPRQRTGRRRILRRAAGRRHRLGRAPPGARAPGRRRPPRRPRRQYARRTGPRDAGAAGGTDRPRPARAAAPAAQPGSDGGDGAAASGPAAGRLLRHRVPHGDPARGAPVRPAARARRRRHAALRLPRPVVHARRADAAGHRAARGRPRRRRPPGQRRQHVRAGRRPQRRHVDGLFRAGRPADGHALRRAGPRPRAAPAARKTDDAGRAGRPAVPRQRAARLVRHQRRHAHPARQRRPGRARGGGRVRVPDRARTRLARGRRRRAGRARVHGRHRRTRGRDPRPRVRAGRVAGRAPGRGRERDRRAAAACAGQRRRRVGAAGRRGSGLLCRSRTAARDRACARPQPRPARGRAARARSGRRVRHPARGAAARRGRQRGSDARARAARREPRRPGPARQPVRGRRRHGRLGAGPVGPPAQPERGRAGKLAGGRRRAARGHGQPRRPGGGRLPGRARDRRTPAAGPAHAGVARRIAAHFPAPLGTGRRVAPEPHAGGTAAPAGAGPGGAAGTGARAAAGAARPAGRHARGPRAARRRAGRRAAGARPGAGPAVRPAAGAPRHRGRRARAARGRGQRARRPRRVLPAHRADGLRGRREHGAERPVRSGQPGVGLHALAHGADLHGRPPEGPAGRGARARRAGGGAVRTGRAGRVPRRGRRAGRAPLAGRPGHRAGRDAGAAGRTRAPRTAALRTRLRRLPGSAGRGARTLRRRAAARAAAPPAAVGPATEIDVATKVPGRVRAIAAEEGEFVAAGQVLATMDTRSMEAQRDEAVARYEQAVAALAGARAQVALRDSDLQAARALVGQRASDLDAARRRLVRSDTLAQEGASSLQELDDDRARVNGTGAALTAARAQVQAAEAAVNAARTQVTSASANEKAAAATIARIDAELADTVLAAPRAGRVQYRIAQPGEVLGAGGKVLNLVDLTDVYMTFFLPETVAGRVGLGSEVRIVLDAAPNYAIPATVSSRRDCRASRGCASIRRRRCRPRWPARPRHEGCVRGRRGRPARGRAHGVWRRARAGRRHAGRARGLRGRPDRPGRRGQVDAARAAVRGAPHPGRPHRGAGRRHGLERAPHPGVPAHRLHAAGAWQEPVSHAVDRGKPAVLRPPVRPRRGPAPAPHRRADAKHGPAPVPGPPGRQAVGRHEAEAGPVLRPDPRPRPPHPRRADDRRRSARAQPVLGTDRAHPRRTARHERDGGDGVHGRGAPLRPAHRDGRRPRARHRHAGRTAGAHRERHAGGRVHRPAAAGAPGRLRAARRAAAGRRRRRRRGDRGARPDHALRRLHGRRQRELSHPPRRDLRFPRLERLRQVDDDEDADRPAPRQRRRGPAVRPSRRRARPRRAAPRRLHVAGVLAVRRTDGAPEPRAARAPVPRAGRPHRRPRGRDGRALRPRRRAGRAAGRPAARHPPAPVARRRDGARAGTADPGRAHVRRRPARARRVLAPDDRPRAARPRDDLHFDPLHERGAALRPHLADARGPRARVRRPAGARRGARRGHARGGVHRVPARRRRGRDAAPAGGAGARHAGRRGHARRPGAHRQHHVARGAGTAARPDPRPAGPRGLAAADVRDGLRHQHGRGKPALRRARPRRFRAQPRLRPEHRRLALFHGASSAVGLRGPGQPHAQRRHRARRRDPARLRARPGARPPGGGRHLGRRRHAAAGRHRHRLRAGPAPPVAGAPGAGTGPADAAAAGVGRDALPLQPGRAQPARDRTGRDPAAPADAAGDADGAGRRAREGAGLHRQPVRHADDAHGIPHREAAAVRRAGAAELRADDHRGRDGVPRARDGQFCGAAVRHPAVRAGHDGHRPVGVRARAQPDRRDVLHDDRHAAAGRVVRRTAQSRLLARRRGTPDRHRVPGQLHVQHQPGRVQQGPGPGRPDRRDLADGARLSRIVEPVARPGAAAADRLHVHGRAVLRRHGRAGRPAPRRRRHRRRGRFGAVGAHRDGVLPAPVRAARPHRARRGRRGAGRRHLHVRPRHPARLPARRPRGPRAAAAAVHRRHPHEPGVHGQRHGPADRAGRSGGIRAALPCGRGARRRRHDPPALQPVARPVLVRFRDGAGQQHHDAVDHPHGRRPDPRTRARHDRTPARDARDAHRDHAVEGVGDGPDRARRRRRVADGRDPRRAGRADPGLRRAVPAVRRAAPVRDDVDGHLHGHRRAQHAAVRAAADADPDPAADAVRRRHPAREHARPRALADVGGADDALRLAEPGHPVPRRRPGDRVAVDGGAGRHRRRAPRPRARGPSAHARLRLDDGGPRAVPARLHPPGAGPGRRARLGRRRRRRQQRHLLPAVRRRAAAGAARPPGRPRRGGRRPGGGRARPAVLDAALARLAGGQPGRPARRQRGAGAGRPGPVAGPHARRRRGRVPAGRHSARPAAPAARRLARRGSGGGRGDRPAVDSVAAGGDDRQRPRPRPGRDRRHAGVAAGGVRHDRDGPRPGGQRRRRRVAAYAGRARGPPDLLHRPAAVRAAVARRRRGRHRHRRPPRDARGAGSVARLVPGQPPAVRGVARGGRAAQPRHREPVRPGRPAARRSRPRRAAGRRGPRGAPGGPRRRRCVDRRRRRGQCAGAGRHGPLSRPVHGRAARHARAAPVLGRRVAPGERGAARRRRQRAHRRRPGRLQPALPAARRRRRHARDPGVRHGRRVDPLLPVAAAARADPVPRRAARRAGGHAARPGRHRRRRPHHRLPGARRAGGLRSARRHGPRRRPEDRHRRVLRPAAAQAVGGAGRRDAARRRRRGAAGLAHAAAGAAPRAHARAPGRHPRQRAGRRVHVRRRRHHPVRQPGRRGHVRLRAGRPARPADRGAAARLRRARGRARTRAADGGTAPRRRRADARRRHERIHAGIVAARHRHRPRRRGTRAHRAGAAPARSEPRARPADRPRRQLGTRPRRRRVFVVGRDLPHVRAAAVMPAAGPRRAAGHDPPGRPRREAAGHGTGPARPGRIRRRLPRAASGRHVPRHPRARRGRVRRRPPAGADARHGPGHHGKDAGRRTPAKARGRIPRAGREFAGRRGPLRPRPALRLCEPGAGRVSRAAVGAGRGPRARRRGRRGVGRRGPRRPRTAQQRQGGDGAGDGARRHGDPRRRAPPAPAVRPHGTGARGRTQAHRARGPRRTRTGADGAAHGRRPAAPGRRRGQPGPAGPHRGHEGRGRPHHRHRAPRHHRPAAGRARPGPRGGARMARRRLRPPLRHRLLAARGRPGGRAGRRPRHRPVPHRPGIADERAAPCERDHRRRHAGRARRPRAARSARRRLRLRPRDHPAVGQVRPAGHARTGAHPRRHYHDDRHHPHHPCRRPQPRTPRHQATHRDHARHGSGGRSGRRPPRAGHARVHPMRPAAAGPRDAQHVRDRPDPARGRAPARAAHPRAVDAQRGAAGVARARRRRGRLPDQGQRPGGPDRRHPQGRARRPLPRPAPGGRDRVRARDGGRPPAARDAHQPRVRDLRAARGGRIRQRHRGAPVAVREDGQHAQAAPAAEDAHDRYRRTDALRARTPIAAGAGNMLRRLRMAERPTPPDADDPIAAIAREIGLDADEIARRKAYLELGDDDLAVLASVHALTGEDGDAFAAGFYDHLLGYGELRELLRDKATRGRLRHGLRAQPVARGRGARAHRPRAEMVHRRLPQVPRDVPGTAGAAPWRGSAAPAGGRERAAEGRLLRHGAGARHVHARRPAQHPAEPELPGTGHRRHAGRPDRRRRRRPRDLDERPDARHARGAGRRAGRRAAAGRPGAERGAGRRHARHARHRRAARRRGRHRRRPRGRRASLRLQHPPHVATGRPPAAADRPRRDVPAPGPPAPAGKRGILPPDVPPGRRRHRPAVVRGPLPARESQADADRRLYGSRAAAAVLPRDHAPGRHARRPRPDPPPGIGRDRRLPARTALRGARRPHRVGRGQRLGNARRVQRPAAADPRRPGHLVAQRGRGSARADGEPRRAHGPAEPHPAAGPAGARDRAGAAHAARGGGPVRRPRPLQARERQPGPRGRRPHDRRDRAPPGRRAARERHGGAPGRRRIRRGAARPGRPGRRGDGGDQAARGAVPAARRLRRGALPHRQRGHRHVPARRRRRPRAAEGRRQRHVPLEGRRRQPLPLLRGRHGGARRAAPVHRRRPAARAAAQRTDAALPAPDRQRQRARRGPGGPAALASGRRGAGRAGRVRAAGGRDGPDRAHRRVGARDRDAPAGGLRPDGLRPAAHEREHLGAPVPGRRGGAGREPGRPHRLRSGHADAGNHGKRADGAARGGRRGHGPARAHGRAARDRRLRHRLLEPRHAAALPDPHAEGRPLVRGRRRAGRRRCGDRRRRARAGPVDAAGSGRRGRRDRSPAPLPAGARLPPDAGLPVRPAAGRRRRRGAAARAAGGGGMMGRARLRISGTTRLAVLVAMLALAAAWIALGLAPLPHWDPGWYLPAHTAMETLAVVVAMLVFSTGAQPVDGRMPAGVAVLSTGALAAGVLDFGHLLSVQGMPGLAGPGTAARGIGFWLAARSAAALSLLAAALVPADRTVPRAAYRTGVAGGLALSAAAYWIVLARPDQMPATERAGRAAVRRASRRHRAAPAPLPGRRRRHHGPGRRPVHAVPHAGRRAQHGRPPVQGDRLRVPVPRHLRRGRAGPVRPAAPVGTLAGGQRSGIPQPDGMRAGRHRAGRRRRPHRPDQRACRAAVRHRARGRRRAPGRRPAAAAPRRRRRLSARAGRHVPRRDQPRRAARRPAGGHRARPVGATAPGTRPARPVDARRADRAAEPPAHPGNAGRGDRGRAPRAAGARRARVRRGRLPARERPLRLDRRRRRAARMHGPPRAAAGVRGHAGAPGRQRIRDRAGGLRVRARDPPGAGPAGLHARAVHAGGAPPGADGQHRHRPAAGARLFRARTAADGAGGNGRFARGRAGRLPLPHAGNGTDAARPDRLRSHVAPRGGARPAGAAVPAARQPAQRRAGRRGSARALAPSRARHRAAGPVHPAGRRDGPDRGHRHVGAARRMRARGRVDRRRAAAGPRVRQPVGAPVPARGPGAARARRARRDRPGAVPSRARDHGRDGDARHRGVGRRAAHAARPGRRAVDRRLRHGLLVARLPEALPARRAQDRPFVRAGRRDRRRRRGHRARHHRARPQPAPGRRGRGRRDGRPAGLPARERLRRGAGLLFQPAGMARRPAPPVVQRRHGAARRDEALADGQPHRRAGFRCILQQVADDALAARVQGVRLHVGHEAVQAPAHPGQHAPGERGALFQLGEDGLLAHVQQQTVFQRRRRHEIRLVHEHDGFAERLAGAEDLDDFFLALRRDEGELHLAVQDRMEAFARVAPFNDGAAAVHVVLGGGRADGAQLVFAEVGKQRQAAQKGAGVDGGHGRVMDVDIGIALFSRARPARGIVRND
ncbi:hypothetical protein Lal_00014968 [Lupinus albus]|nr:hypothetical protein Lal_00014968 [Lupinus albus]